MQEEKRRVIRKVYWRVLPFTFILSILDYFDRCLTSAARALELFSCLLVSMASRLISQK